MLPDKDVCMIRMYDRDQDVWGHFPRDQRSQKLKIRMYDKDQDASTGIRMYIERI